MRSNYYKFKLILLSVIILLTVIFMLVGATIIDKQLQYKLIFGGNEKTVTCTVNKDGILIAPLKDVAEFIGYKVEECERCGKDEVFDASDKTTTGKGHLFVNWYKNIITYSNDASIISLDAINDKYNNGITYTSLQLYKYIGFTYSVDDSNKIITLTRVNDTLNSSSITKETNLDGDDSVSNDTLSSSSAITAINESDLGSDSTAVTEDSYVDAKITEISYAYDPNCTSCEEITKLLDNIKSKYGIQIEKIDATVDTNKNKIESYNSNCSVPEVIRDTYPILYIGNQYLFDVEISMGNIETLLARDSITHNFKNESWIKLDSSQEDTKVQVQVQQDKPKVLVYFYSSTCASCKKAENYIKDLEKKYSDVKLITYNLFDAQNIKLLEAYGQKYNLDKNKLDDIPAVFLSQTALVGDKDIINMLQDNIETYDFDYPTEVIDLSTIKDKNTLTDRGTMKFMTVFGAGLVNGINPCSLSMFLFLLSIMIVEKKKILKIGLSFCFGKFVMFFLLGTLFYKVLSFLNINIINIVAKGFLILVIATFAILNLNDFIAAKMENYDKMVLQLPHKLKKIYHGLMRKTSSYANSKYLIIIMVLLGMLLAFGEFLCTGQIYLTSIVFLIQNNGINLIPIIYLLIYSFAFVIPIIAITILAYYGKKVFNLSEILLERLPLIKIISSLIFIAFGIYIVFLT